MLWWGDGNTQTTYIHAYSDFGCSQEQTPKGAYAHKKNNYFISKKDSIK